jgi:hypothetical protein
MKQKISRMWKIAIGVVSGYTGFLAIVALVQIYAPYLHLHH